MGEKSVKRCTRKTCFDIIRGINFRISLRIHLMGLTDLSILPSSRPLGVCFVLVYLFPNIFLKHNSTIYIAQHDVLLYCRLIIIKFKIHCTINIAIIK